MKFNKQEVVLLLTPYLTFHGKCEEAFEFYARVFGGGKTVFVRRENNPNNPIMHATITFTKYDGCIMGADIEGAVVISGMAICFVLPSRKVKKYLKNSQKVVHLFRNFYHIQFRMITMVERKYLISLDILGI